MLPYDDQPTYIPPTHNAGGEESRTAEARELLWKAVNELRDEYRTVILLRQQADLSFVEIAERMQRSARDVRLMWGQAILELGVKLSGTE